jgi:hypothetical protein
VVLRLQAFPQWLALPVLPFSGPTSASSACYLWRMSLSGSSGAFLNFPLNYRQIYRNHGPNPDVAAALAATNGFVLSAYTIGLRLSARGQAVRLESPYNSEWISPKGATGQEFGMSYPTWDQTAHRVNRSLAAKARAGAAAAALLMAGAMLAGCSAVSDDAKPDAMYGGTPSQATADAVFPDLRSVPQQRPAASTLEERKDVARDLAADREEAIQAEDALRSGALAPTGASTSVTARPTPLPQLSDLPPDVQKHSLYADAPIIPMPTDRGGHSDFTKVLPERLLKTAAAKTEASGVVTEDGAPAAAPASSTASEDTGPEVTAAPTRHVTVKPAIGAP